MEWKITQKSMMQVTDVSSVAEMSHYKKEWNHQRNDLSKEHNKTVAVQFIGQFYAIFLNDQSVRRGRRVWFGTLEWKSGWS